MFHFHCYFWLICHDMFRQNKRSCNSIAKYEMVELNIFCFFFLLCLVLFFKCVIIKIVLAFSLMNTIKSKTYHVIHCIQRTYVNLIFFWFIFALFFLSLPLSLPDFKYDCTPLNATSGVLK